MRKWEYEGKEAFREVYYGVSAIQIFSTSEVSTQTVRELAKDASHSSSVIDGMLYQEITNFPYVAGLEYYCFLNIIVGVISYYDDIYLLQTGY